MSVHHLLAADPYAMTSGRVWALVAGSTGLLGIVVGGLALARAAGRLRSRPGSGPGRRGAFVALVAGLVSAAVGGLVVATADGGLGTGNGLGGGVVAVVAGLISVVLGGLVLARAGRTA